MRCDGCGTEDAFRVRAVWDKYLQEKIECCDRCGNAGAAGLPDVYWDGKPEHGLADDPVTGQPRVFSSKREKAQYLRDRNLVEAGDRVRGSHVTAGSQDVSVGSRGHSDVARRALHKVSQMGRDFRRQEYLRIVKESGRA